MIIAGTKDDALNIADAVTSWKYDRENPEIIEGVGEVYTVNGHEYIKAIIADGIMTVKTYHGDDLQIMIERPGIESVNREVTPGMVDDVIGQKCVLSEKFLRKVEIAVSNENGSKAAAVFNWLREKCHTESEHRRRMEQVVISYCSDSGINWRDIREITMSEVQKGEFGKVIISALIEE